MQNVKGLKSIYKVHVFTILFLGFHYFAYSQCEIYGQVYYGQPFEKGVGATVRELEKKTGVLVGSDGSFSYSSTTSKKFTIQFSFEGMEPVDYVFDATKYLSYKVRVNLYPKGKLFNKNAKSSVSIKEKIKKPVVAPDETAPTISVPLAEESSLIYTQSAQIIINGKVSDNAGIKEVLINDAKPALNSEGSFQYILDLAPGENTILIKATDINNNKRKYSFFVKREIPLNTNTKRAALIIGNADYQTSKLVNTINDADDLAHKLQSFGFELFKLENLTNKLEIENAIIQFCKKVKNYDLVVFYYSGHGLQVNGLNYIVPTKAVLNSQEVVKNYCVEITNILNEMAGAQCKYKIVILDACRDNPFEKNWAGRSVNGSGKGLAEMSYATNTLVMFATAPGAIASDNLSGRNGLFTQELLKNMDKDISIDQIFKLTGRSVAGISGNCQVPWISSSLFDDIFLKK